jgi:hypothetical protein
LNLQSSAQRQRNYQLEREQRQKRRDDAEKQKPALEFENIILRKTTVNDLKQIYGESYDEAITQLIRLAKGERSRRMKIEKIFILKNPMYNTHRREELL